MALARRASEDVMAEATKRLGDDENTWEQICLIPTNKQQITGWESELGLTSVTGASGGGVGAGTWCTGFGQGRARAAVESRLALLTVGPLGVSLTVQAHSWKADQHMTSSFIILLPLESEIACLNTLSCWSHKASSHLTETQHVLTASAGEYHQLHFSRSMSEALVFLQKYLKKSMHTFIIVEC